MTDTEELEINGEIVIIRVHYDPPPIPIRKFDYRAVEDDYDYDRPIGYGQTRQEAIDDLKELLLD